MSEPGGSSSAHLLKVQEVDTSIDQLMHRRSHLPELAEIDAIKVRAVYLRTALVNATTERDALAGRQATIEAEVQATVARIAQIDARLYGTATVSPKDAQSMSEEQVHLRQRRSDFEDTELEVMEALEPAQAKFEEAQANAQALATEMQEVQARLVAKQSELDAEVAEKRGARATLAADIGPALMAEYERLRGRLGGTAAAPLVGAQCGGCHLTISGSELDEIRSAPADAVIHCDECGRILVRQ